MSFQMFNRNVVASSTSAKSTSTSVVMTSIDGISIQPVYSDGTPGAKTFVAANVTPAADTITITAHGFLTGLKVALTGTNLPGGLSATNYWVIVVDANTIKLATSLVNANAGTAVDITTAGTTADAALTPASLSFAFKLQAGNDGSNWVDIPGTNLTITAAGTSMFNIDPIDYNYINIVTTATSGALTIRVQANAIRRTQFQ